MIQVILNKSRLPQSQYLYPLIIVMGLSIALLYLYSLFFQGESFLPSPRGPWIDPGPPLWINWSSAKIINQALQAGNIPLWTDMVGIGVPFFSDPHLSYFSPFSFILYLAPNSYGWDVMVLSKAILTLTFAYMLALRLGQNPWISIFAATLYGFSGHVYQFQHHFHTNSLVFLPLVLIAVIDIFEAKLKRGMLLTAIALPLIVFGGGLLDLILLVLLLVFISVSYVVFQAGSGVLYQTRISKVFFAALIFILSVAIAAIWIFPYFELRELSIPPRPGRSTAYYDDSWYLFGLFIKNSMFTDLKYAHWFMKQVQYLSIIALPGFIAGVSFFVVFKSRYNYVYIGFLALILVQILKVYGFPWLQFISDIPILQDIRYEKYTGLYTLGFFLIAGYGYQNLFITKINYARLIIMLSTLLIVLLMIGYRIKYQIEWDSSLVVYLCLAIYPLLLFLFWHTKIKTMLMGRIAIIFLTTMVILYQLKFDTDTQFAKRVEIFDKDEIVAAALKVSETNRFLPIVGVGPRRWAADGLNDVRDISVVHVDRYYKYFKNIIENKGHCWHKFVLCAQADVIYLQGLRWLGVDTLILTEKTLTLLDKNPDKAWQPAGSYGDYYFVKLNNVDPLVSILTPSQISRDIPSISTIRNNLWKNQQVNYLENVDIRFPHETKPVEWRVDSVRKQGVNSVIDVYSSNPAFLMVKQQYYPGWVATVSGQPASIYQANYLFQAVPIPAGRSQVSLSYRPASLKWGMLISFLAIMMLIAVYRRISVRNMSLQEKV